MAVLKEAVLKTDKVLYYVAETVVREMLKFLSFISLKDLKEPRLILQSLETSSLLPVLQI